MKRREFIALVGVAALARPHPLYAQRVAKVPRIGLLGAASVSGYGSLLEALRQGPDS